ncbi:hypothetical protein C8Q74DRAFT_208119 [Fomes fomentarius]|nr:hypothetical protein C8Q74DRAFT_208119 [Fomes fomentarius]
MSFLARILRRFRSPTSLVGRDLEGNRFYEYPSVSDVDPRRTKRVVKYAQGTEMLDYVAGHRRLAVQWTSWLTHTRPHPPTLEELQADLERRRRIMINVAMIEARDREQAARIAGSEQPTLAPHLQAMSTPQGTVGSAEQAPEPASAETQPARTGAQTLPPLVQTSDRDPSSPWKPPPRDEPHSWKPAASVRRGG